MKHIILILYTVDHSLTPQAWNLRQCCAALCQLHKFQIIMWMLQWRRHKGCWQCVVYTWTFIETLTRRGASNAALERRFFILVYESHTDLNFLSTSSFLSAVTSFRGSVGRRWTQSLPPMSSRRHRHLFACVNERLIINGFVRRGSFMLPTYYLHGLQWRVLQDSRLVWSSPPVWNPKSQTPCPQIWKLPTKQLFTHFKKICLVYNCSSFSYFVHAVHVGWRTLYVHIIVSPLQHEHPPNNASN